MKKRKKKKKKKKRRKEKEKKKKKEEKKKKKRKKKRRKKEEKKNKLTSLDTRQLQKKQDRHHMKGKHRSGYSTKLFATTRKGLDTV